LRAIRDAGGDVASVCAALDLAPEIEHHADTVIALEQLQALYDEAAQLTGDPSFGLHLATNFPRGTYGIVEFIARSSATVREGWERIAELSRVMSPQVSVTITERTGEVSFDHAIPGRPLVYGRHGNEFFVPAVLLQTRGLIGPDFVPTRAWFAHPAHDQVDELARTLGTTQITFSAGSNGVALPKALLDRPVPSADPPLLSTLTHAATRALETDPPARSFVEMVRADVGSRMEGGAATLEATAQAFHMSPRTLQRRLGDEGTTFANIVDAVREELARAWVAEGKLGLGEVTFRLGYADVPAFVRAFKRWTKMTPTSYRERSKG